MCLILLAIKKHPEYKLIIAANRDEYYDRPTAPATFWEDTPDMLAGKDLRAGGTWLGITRNGRIGAITNYRDPASRKKNTPSRGRLVSNFLLCRESPVEYLDNLAQDADNYNGFNLIIGDKDQLFWYSNQGKDMYNLSPGIYGLSNRLLDTPWPKIIRGKNALEHILSEREDPSPEELFQILNERTIADDESLPNTGVGPEWEIILSPIFILSPTYGTRSSTLLFIDMHDRVTFIEKTHNSNPDHTRPLKYEFQIQS